MKRTTAGLTALLLSTTSLQSATLLPNGQQQFLNGNGQPYAGGSVTFYSNFPACTILKNTWSNSAQTVLNTNPVVLDSAGRATIFGSGTYCQVLKDSSGNTIWTKETGDASSTSNLGWGSTSGGTANAQTVTVTGFSSTNGQTFYFVAGATNTGALTLSVNGGSPISVVKTTPSGTALLTGQEVAAGNVIGVTYYTNTGQFQLVTNNNQTLYVSGEVKTFAMNSCPAGWAETNGAAISRTTYASLFSAIGTTWGSGNGSTTFNIPDFRGQFLRGWDHGKNVDTTNLTGSITSGSTTISNLSTTSFMFVGMPVSGTGIPSGATVATISSTSITISAAASSTSGVFTGSITNGSTNVAGIAGTAGLVIGQGVSGTGLQAGTTIAAITSSSSIVLSLPATTTTTSTLTFANARTTLLFRGRAFGSYESDEFQSHTHADGGHSHSYNFPQGTAQAVGGSGSNYYTSGGATTSPSTGIGVANNQVTGNSETRPMNYAVLYCIKY